MRKFIGEVITKFMRQQKICGVWIWAPSPPEKERSLRQFSIIEFKIEGTPGKDNTFLVIKPGAALDGL